MNTLLLQPTDLLFFRDGRPMGGSSAGHGAAWPLPTVTNAALHAALWRSGLAGHKHDHRRGRTRALTDARQFGSLVTAGPFPVSPEQRWYFPRPLDLGNSSLKPTLHPCAAPGTSSLPVPLTCVLGNSETPSKDSNPKAWLSTEAYQAYLRGEDHRSAHGAIDDSDFSDSEATIGIGIDPATQAQDGTNIYSAHYLRLRDGWRMGVIASTSEKMGDARDDLIPKLITDSHHIIIGGQQRICSATLGHLGHGEPILPRGLATFAPGQDGKVRVKWVLLSPAIFPAIELNGVAHPGGWLPSWVRQSDGAVQLRAETEPRGPREPRDAWRARVQNQPMIAAKLVAALVPKPITVTGWALGDAALGEDMKLGAKPAQLAVPAGTIYYFTCDTPDAAKALAIALNWHGLDPKDNTIKNRRSTLLGEKGFGLGVCGTWACHQESRT